MQLFHICRPLQGLAGLASTSFQSAAYVLVCSVGFKRLAASAWVRPSKSGHRGQKEPSMKNPKGLSKRL